MNRESIIMAETIEVQGHCDDRFEDVKEVFAKNFKLGLDVGASLAVTLEGEFVVDLWAGYANATKTRPWEKETIVCVFSTTKVMTTICTLMLVDRGLLDLDAPVAKYWPEFAQNGKEELPVRYLLSHGAGLLTWDEKIPIETLYDWDQCITLLASQKPQWEPGTKSTYHAITFGYLLGELVRRITGKSLGNFFRDEVAGPLNADFHIGLAEEHDSRVADIIPPKLPLIIKIFNNRVFKKIVKYFHMGLRVISNPDLASIYILTDVMKTRGWRGAEIPASNGHGNARSIARITAALACGGKLDGVRLLSASTIEKALEEQYYGKDKVLGAPQRYGLGFGLPSKTDSIPFPHPRTLYWGGFGGSQAIIDVDAKMSIGFAMNNLILFQKKDPRILRFIEAIYKAYESL